MIKYSKDGRVAFEPVRHTYTLDGVKNLMGVTTLISKYKHKFDTEAVATAYADKHGLDKDTLIKEWAAKGADSLANGSAVHAVFENYILNQVIMLGDYPKEQIAKKFIDEIFMTGKLFPVEAEMVVYNDHIASMIDCIVQNAKGEYFILDWKTNAEIKKNGYGKTKHPPFHSYPDASFYHYSLQCSIYRKLCTEYPIKSAFIVHIGENDYEFIKAVDIIIPEDILSPKELIRA